MVKSKQPKNKVNTKVIQSQRRRRRQMLTFVRMVRYGVNNFSRNIWLTIAATAVMTITLLVIFMAVAAQNILQDTVDAVSDNVDMSIYLKSDVTEDQAGQIMSDLNNLSVVVSTSFISSDQARKDDAENQKGDQQYLDAISEANSAYPATIRVKVDDINDTSQLENFVATNENVKQYLNENREPSFAGAKRDAIKSIGEWTVIARQVGIVASLVFVVIASLIVFNTIRMAIFSRKDEIEMMKLIGANKGFIRGPFVVEAIVYGFIAAVLATTGGYFLLVGMSKFFAGTGIEVLHTADLVLVYLGVVMILMILLGAIIGTISALLATRKYLKV